MAKSSIETVTFFASKNDYRAQVSPDKCVYFAPLGGNEIGGSYTTSDADEIKRLREMAEGDRQHLRETPFGMKTPARPMSRQVITTGQAEQG